MKTKNNIYIKHCVSLFFFFCLGLQSYTVSAQTTSIPDEYFEQALIDQGIDSDGTVNGQVLTSDIDELLSLNVEFVGIEDLTGLEDFSALEVLNVTGNYLTTLDVSNNIQLKELYCSSAAEGFSMLFTSLDLSNNINLEILYAENLILENLNLQNGNNELLTVTLPCEFEGNPCQLTDLHCVMVDDEDAANNDEPPYDSWYIQADDFIYSEDCSLNVANQKKNILSFYPNPVTDILYIKKHNVRINNVKIYTVSGKSVLENKGDLNQINVNNLSSGVFIIEVSSDKGSTFQKMVKQ